MVRGGGLQQVLHLVHRVGRLGQVAGSGQRVVHPGRRRVDQAGGGVQQVLHFVRGVGPGVDHDGVDGGGVEDVPVADQVGHTQWHFTFFPLIDNVFTIWFYDIIESFHNMVESIHKVVESFNWSPLSQPLLRRR